MAHLELLHKRTYHEDRKEASKEAEAELWAGERFWCGLKYGEEVRRAEEFKLSLGELEDEPGINGD